MDGVQLLTGRPCACICPAHWFHRMQRFAVVIRRTVCLRWHSFLTPSNGQSASRLRCGMCVHRRRFCCPRMVCPLPVIRNPISSCTTSALPTACHMSVVDSISCLLIRDSTLVHALQVHYTGVPSLPDVDPTDWQHDESTVSPHYECTTRECHPDLVCIRQIGNTAFHAPQAYI